MSLTLISSRNECGTVIARATTQNENNKKKTLKWTEKPAAHKTFDFSN